jgi:hypothetical protein
MSDVPKEKLKFAEQRQPGDFIYDELVCRPSQAVGFDGTADALLAGPLERAEQHLRLGVPESAPAWQQRAVVLAAAADERAASYPVERGLPRSPFMTGLRAAVAPYIATTLPRRLMRGTALIGELRLARNIIEHRGFNIVTSAVAYGETYDSREVERDVIQAAHEFAFRWQEGAPTSPRLVPAILTAAILKRTTHVATYARRERRTEEMRARVVPGRISPRLMDVYREVRLTGAQ